MGERDGRTLQKIKAAFEAEDITWALRIVVRRLSSLLDESCQPIINALACGPQSRKGRLN